MNFSLTPRPTSPAGRKSNAPDRMATNDGRSIQVLDEIMAEVSSMISDQENQPDQTAVFDGQRVHRQIPSGVLDNQYFQTLRQAREAALATARQFGTGYTIKQHTNPAKGTAHFHVVSPAGSQVSGHFFYGQKPRFIPKTQDIPAHRRRKTEGNGRRRRELELEQEFTAQDVIHPDIDVYAQYSIQRMQKSPDLGVRADGNGLLAAVKSGQLRGIYKEDQYVPAMRAKKLNKGWWQIIPKGEDAVLFLDTVDPPIITFRDSVRSDAARLDPALLATWKSFKLYKQEKVQACPVPQVYNALYSSTIADSFPLSNVVPTVCGGGGSACKLPSTEQAGNVMVKGVAFDFKIVPLAFNPAPRGEVDLVGGKLLFSCRRDVPADPCKVLVRVPAWRYAATVSISSGGNQKDWEFGFIQNVEQNLLQLTYENGIIRQCSVKNLFDAISDSNRPWASPIGFQNMNSGKLAILEDSPGVKAPLKYPISSSNTLRQVCLKGVFHIWLVARKIGSNELILLAFKEIDVFRKWTNNDSQRVSDPSSWLRFGGQQEAVRLTGSMSTPLPKPVITGPLANSQSTSCFKDAKNAVCSEEPPAFDDACIMGSTCEDESQWKSIINELISKQALPPADNEFTLLGEILAMNHTSGKRPYREPAPPPPKKKPGLSEKDWGEIIRDVEKNPVPQPRPGPPSYDPADPNRTTYQPPKSNLIPGRKPSQFPKSRVPRRR